MDKHEYTYLRGTMGSPDYLLIAQRGGVALGFKPLIGIGTSGIILGARVRSCEAPHVVHKEDGTAEFPVKMGWAEAWPSIKFDKVDDTRASVVIQTQINTVPQTQAELSAALDATKFWDKMLAWVQEHVPAEHMVMGPDDLLAWLRDTYSVYEESGLSDQAAGMAAKKEADLEAAKKIVADAEAEAKAGTKPLEATALNSEPGPSVGLVDLTKYMHKDAPNHSGGEEDDGDEGPDAS